MSEQTEPVAPQQELEPQQLEDVSGGLPAIQKVRDAANRSSSSNLTVTDEPLTLNGQG